jgi:hypothetical protein
LLQLKFELLCHGIEPSRAALDALPTYRSGSVVVRDYPSTSGLILQLPGDRFVNARLRFDSPLAFPLDHDPSGFRLQVGDDLVPVEVFPPAQYALENHRLSSGKSIVSVANTHADRVRLTPIYGCAYHCDFCSYPGLVYRRNTLDELSESLRIALADRIISPPHVLVSGGTARIDEQDYRYVNDIYRALPGLFPDLVWDLMLSPHGLYPGRRTARAYANFVKRLKEWGFDALSVNLELYNEKARRQYMPEKHEIGRAGYFTFLEQAVEWFGRGKVRSVLIVGLEPERETLTAVDALAKRGVLVELSPFWADPGTFLAQHPEPTPAALMSIYEKTMECTTRHCIPMVPFCIPCAHNIL